MLALLLVTVAGAGTHSGGSIAIVDGMTAVFYPSPITVAGETAIGKVTVSLNDLTHDYPDDIDMLLVGPSPENVKVVLMSDAGNGTPGVALADITFDDAGAELLDEAANESGTYHPNDYPETDCDPAPEPEFPPPAPGGPYGTDLADFIGSTANGVWNLYVLDDCALFAPGGLIAGWSLTITPPTAVRVAGLRAAARNGAVVVSWRTASETGVLGFNVYRSAGTTTTKVNRVLIPAKAAGQAGGAHYRLLDRLVRPDTSYTYRLQAVEASGKRSWSGSVSTRTSR